MGNEFISPIYKVCPVSIEKIQANWYNPNRISPPEMNLLEKSILEDGYTTPIVCFYLENEDKYEIVDGFHRYLIMKNSKVIAERENYKLPVVLIETSIDNRIASTIRHNRARGAHSIDRLVDIVQNLISSGISDQWIISNIGMGEDELLRLKQLSGITSLFKNNEFSQAWESDDLI